MKKLLVLISVIMFSFCGYARVLEVSWLETGEITGKGKSRYGGGYEYPVKANINRYFIFGHLKNFFQLLMMQFASLVVIAILLKS